MRPSGYSSVSLISSLTASTSHIPTSNSTFSIPVRVHRNPKGERLRLFSISKVCIYALVQREEDLKFESRFVLLVSFNQKLLLMTELPAGEGGGKTSEPHQRFLPTVCIVCKLRPVFCVLLQRS